MSIIKGDCREVMAGMEPDSVDAIVTDPPYGLEFMGKEWDAPWKSAVTLADPASVAGFQDGSGGNAYSRSRVRSDVRRHGGDQSVVNAAFQAWSESWAREAYRVLKPGGHLLAFGGSRTYHRMACAVEDAGFEIRDQIQWIFGSGFPKSLDVSKAIDKAAGAERERLGRRGDSSGRRVENHNARDGVTTPFRSGWGNDVTAPATDLARQWQGWGTALKPAHEPIVVARKPLIGTVAANVEAHGTGAINVDGCRIGYQDEADKRLETRGVHSAGAYQHPAGDSFKKAENPVAAVNHAGRWPANVVMDEEAGAMLDEQSGQVSGGGPRRGANEQAGSMFGLHGGPHPPRQSGGPSRYFYCPKASRAERERGLEGERCGHPTVKPVALMRWLVRLVTPPGGLVLDPFAGSGTTGIACSMEGFEFVGIEMDSEYAEIAEKRIAAAPLMLPLT